MKPDGQASEAGQQPAVVQEAGQQPAVVQEAGQQPAVVQEAGRRPAVVQEAGRRPAVPQPLEPSVRSPVLSSLGRYLPRAAASLAEMEALRRRAWRQDGVLALRDGDDRLSWPERELVRQIGERLYGARAEITSDN